MRILVTGNMGYIGPVVVDHLSSSIPGSEIIGLDTAYFGHCLTGSAFFPEIKLSSQIFCDIRSVQSGMLKNIDSIVHLAGLSNDPIGKTFESLTNSINCEASIRLAKLSKNMGVKQFVFASSCSVYGSADGPPRKESDPLNPLTAYAKSKIDAEQALSSLADANFTVTCLRFATACGMSPRLRLDLVLNDFVASSILSQKIQILSDGTPWRPLIHVSDMARAIEWAVCRDKSHSDSFLALNIGSHSWNYQVIDLANAVAEIIPSVQIDINRDALPDKRSYQVDFSLFERLAPRHQPHITLDDAISGLKNGLSTMNITQTDFRNSDLMRLKILSRLRKSNILDNNLNWA